MGLMNCRLVVWTAPSNRLIFRTFRVYWSCVIECSFVFDLISKDHFSSLHQLILNLIIISHLHNFFITIFFSMSSVNFPSFFRQRENEKFNSAYFSSFLHEHKISTERETSDRGGKVQDFHESAAKVTS